MNYELQLQYGGTLADRARHHLAEGPRSTAHLAEAVLGLRGHPSAAAAAVFTLLGSDARFSVDGQGVWSLAELAPTPVSRRLRDEEWVVVDVETTGGSPIGGDRITEVAAVWVSGGSVTRTYSTLVNPQRRIPSMITSLTGLTQEMVDRAPYFHEISTPLMEALKGRVFVAHNAAFDWRFVGGELERATGSVLRGRRLCTVRLGRRLLPQLRSRSLDSLATYFGLEIASRHRALDDAVATAHVLLRFIDLLEERGLPDWEGLDSFLRMRKPRPPRRQAMPRSMDSA